MSRTVRQSSYAGVAQKAINADNAISASYATTAATVLGNITSASYAATASLLLGSVTSASYARTASYSTTLGASLSNDSNGVLRLGNSAGTTISSITALTASFALSSSQASTSSFVNILNQNVIITGSLTVGSRTGGATENTLTLGPPPAGGTGEGGQIGLQATGGSFTSASFIDTYQDQFRILKGPNGGSDTGILSINLQTRNATFLGAITASGFNGLPNDYLYATRNTNQTIGSGTWANRDIIFNNSAASKGISYDTGTGLASLTGGKVYRITARLAWSAAAAYLLQFSCYDSSNSQIGPTVEIVQSTNGTNNISDGTLDFIYAPVSNVSIKIRTTNNTSALSGEFIRGDLNTQLIIQQIA
jgi:hypothetical protein